MTRHPGSRLESAKDCQARAAIFARAVLSPHARTGRHPHHEPRLDLLAGLTGLRGERRTIVSLHRRPLMERPVDLRCRADLSCSLARPSRHGTRASTMPRPRPLLDGELVRRPRVPHATTTTIAGDHRLHHCETLRGRRRGRQGWAATIRLIRPVVDPSCDVVAPGVSGSGGSALRAACRAPRPTDRSC